jgi:hypothetical protein
MPIKGIYRNPRDGAVPIKGIYLTCVSVLLLRGSDLCNWFLVMVLYEGGLSKSSA